MFPISFDILDRKTGATLSRHSVRNEDEERAVLTAAQNTHGEECYQANRKIAQQAADEIAKAAVAEFARGLLCYVEDGNVIELHECGFVQELREAAGATEEADEDDEDDED